MNCDDLIGKYIAKRCQYNPAIKGDKLCPVYKDGYCLKDKVNKGEIKLIGWTDCYDVPCNKGGGV